MLKETLKNSIKYQQYNLTLQLPMTRYLVLKIWPFYELGYWVGFATHASLCNTLRSNKCPKTVKILAVKGLIRYYTCPVHMKGSLNGTYSFSLLYIPTALLVASPSWSLVNSNVDMLSKSLARCLQTCKKMNAQT